MTHLEARIRRRLRCPLFVRVRITDCGQTETVFEDDSVVKLRYRRDGVRIWTYWTGKHTEPEVREWWYPMPDEVVVER
jgi:hypothetical protein